MSLADRWPLGTGHDVRDALLAAYADPSRGYHDTRHLTEVLDRLDELADGGERFATVPVGLAAWFHDAVYEGHADDEERSALWAEQALTGLGVSPAVVADTARLVRLTAGHRPAPDDADGHALSDADLAILAAPAARYAEYAAAVRREYAHVSEADFRSGRAMILRDLLAKPQLFHTGHGRTHWEQRARANVAHELGDGC